MFLTCSILRNYFHAAHDTPAPTTFVAATTTEALSTATTTMALNLIVFSCVVALLMGIILILIFSFIIFSCYSRKTKQRPGDAVNTPDDVCLMDSDADTKS
jgi:hypothetical protein